MAEYFNGLNSFRVLEKGIQNDGDGNERKETHKTRMLSLITCVSSSSESLIKKRVQYWNNEIFFSFTK
jgi:hypothetical protein